MKLAMALAFTLLAATVAAQQERPSDGSARSWDPAAAAVYLDARMDLWFANGTKLFFDLPSDDGRPREKFEITAGWPPDEFDEKEHRP